MTDQNKIIQGLINNYDEDDKYSIYNIDDNIFNNYKVEVAFDEAPTNPLKDLDILHLIGGYPNTKIGDHSYNIDNYEWHELKEQIENDYSIYTIQSLYIENDGGDHIYNIDGEGSQVGFCFIANKDKKDFDSQSQAVEYIRPALEQYSQWANGLVYQANLFHNGALVDSLSGLYGTEKETIKEFLEDHAEFPTA